MKFIIPILLLIFLTSEGLAQAQIGQSIFEEYPDQSLYGWNVAINAIGNRIAISDVHNPENVEFAGHVRVYEFTNDQWMQIGTDIDGLGPNALGGLGMDLSRDGISIAFGKYRFAPEVLDDLDEDALEIYHQLKQGTVDGYPKIRTHAGILSELGKIENDPTLTNILINEAGFFSPIFKGLIDEFTGYSNSIPFGCSFCGGDTPHIETILENLTKFHDKYYEVDANGNVINGMNTVIKLLNSGKKKAKGTSWVMEFANSKNYPNARFEELISEPNGDFSVDFFSVDPDNIYHECKSWKNASGLIVSSNAIPKLQFYARNTTSTYEKVEFNFRGSIPTPTEFYLALKNHKELWDVIEHASDYRTFFNISPSMWNTFGIDPLDVGPGRLRFFEYIRDNRYSDLIKSGI